MKAYRIDPANGNGIHIVDMVNGCERVFIPKDEMVMLADDIMKTRSLL